MPPNTKKCCETCYDRYINLMTGVRDCSSCPCHTPSPEYYKDNSGGFHYSTPTPEKPKHTHITRDFVDGCPACYPPTPAVEELKHPKLNPVCTDDCGNGILCPEKDKHFEKLRKSAEEISKQDAVEDWEKAFDGYVPWVPSYLKPEDASRMDKELKSFIHSLRESDRKRTIEGLEKIKKERPNDEYQDEYPAGYNQAISDAIKFITNLK